jgi:hypothetical protein
MNDIHVRIFSNLEQVKKDLKSQLSRADNHLEHDLKTLTTKRDRAAAIAQYQGFRQGILYAIAAIEDYQNSAEKLQQCSK